MIDLYEYTPAVKEFIRVEVERFTKTHPEVEVASGALYSSPLDCWLFLNFDSVGNAQSVLKEWSEEGEPWVGEDEDGSFNNSCPDFDFFEFGRMDFDEWCDEIEESTILTIRSDTVYQIDLEEDGDEAANVVFFQWLQSIVKELEAEEVFRGLNKASTFRLGVQILDSECEAFWASE